MGGGRLGGASLALIGLAAPALAQTTPAPAPPPPQSIPSREQVTPPTPLPPPPATVSIDSRGAVAQPACPFEASTLKLTLTRVTFTRPDGSPLQPEIANSLRDVAIPTGEQPIRVICDLRDDANTALRRDGWIASVQIPQQSIAGGELKLVVVTVHIAEIRVRGTPGPYRKVLVSRIEALQALDPLNERDAERALLLAGDIPGLAVQLALRPAGTKPGDVIGDLNLVYRPFAVLANAQNYNSHALGRETGYVRGEIYGLTGLSDITYIGLSSTADFKEQRIVQAGHILGLDAAGTTFGVRGTYAWSRPDLGALDLRTNTLIAGFDVVRPIIRSVRTNLRAAIGFDYVNQDTRVGTGTTQVPLNLDKLRVGFGRVSGELFRRRFDGSTALSVRGALEVRKGLGLFGATPSTYQFGAVLPSRIQGDSQATVVRGDLDVLARIAGPFSYASSIRGQWANKPLLNYEEFSLGNLTVGRGYDPGANSGDRAIGVHSELRVDVPVTPTLIPQVFGFYDNVWLTNLDASSTEVGRHFRSFGGGLRLTISDLALIEATYAHPLDRALTIDKAPPPNRFLLSLIVRFRGAAR